MNIKHKMPRDILYTLTSEISALTEFDNMVEFDDISELSFKSGESLYGDYNDSIVSEDLSGSISDILSDRDSVAGSCDPDNNSFDDNNSIAQSNDINSIAADVDHDSNYNITSVLSSVLSSPMRGMPMGVAGNIDLTNGEPIDLEEYSRARYSTTSSTRSFQNRLDRMQSLVENMSDIIERLGSQNDTPNSGAIVIDNTVAEALEDNEEDEEGVLFRLSLVRSDLGEAVYNIIHKWIRHRPTITALYVYNNEDIILEIIDVRINDVILADNPQVNRIHLDDEALENEIVGEYIYNIMVQNKERNPLITVKYSCNSANFIMAKYTCDYLYDYTNEVSAADDPNGENVQQLHHQLSSEIDRILELSDVSTLF